MEQETKTKLLILLLAITGRSFAYSTHSRTG
jgi:hypothetical protein